MIRASVILLAGGAASRLPGKLALPAGDVPLLVRTYRNIASDRTILLSRAAHDPALDALDALLPIASVVDDHTGRGPLDGLLTTMSVLTCERVFAVAGDMPHVDAALLDRIEARWQAFDEAIVPAYARDENRRIEPLAALYDRRAFLREGARVFEAGHGSVTRVIERLRVRFVEDEDPGYFTNLNTPDDYAALRARDRQTA